MLLLPDSIHRSTTHMTVKDKVGESKTWRGLLYLWQSERSNGDGENFIRIADIVRG
jgi:hypothetical protein